MLLLPNGSAFFFSSNEGVVLPIFSWVENAKLFAESRRLNANEFYTLGELTSLDAVKEMLQRPDSDSFRILFNPIVGTPEHMLLLPSQLMQAEAFRFGESRDLECREDGE
ncbi:hypothetical protein [Lacipirellula sp.]|uniref:hypothetical protein n=1 Tax=Lacipirellula sp. TaxID=2691419 RepID=UPI003D097A57